MSKHPRRPSTRLHGGFTLVELLVALTVFAVIAATAHTTLTQTTQHGEHIQNRLRQFSALETSLELLQEDLLQYLERKTRDEFGDHQASLIMNAPDGRLLQLTCSGHANPGLKLPRSELGRVQYRIEKGQLIRDLWRELDRTQGAHRYRVRLLSGVTGIRLRILDHRGQWRRSWPPPENPNPARPRGLELELNTETWGTVSRVIPLS